MPFTPSRALQQRLCAGVTSVLVVAAASLVVGCGGRTLSENPTGEAPPLGSGTPRVSPVAGYPSGMIATYGSNQGVSFFSYATGKGFSPIGALAPGSWENDACQQIAFDAQRNLYLTCTNQGSSPSSRVVVFASGAMGDALPTRVLTAPLMAASNLTGSAVDSKGNVYVVAQNTDPSYDGADGAIVVFGPGSDSVPIRVIQGPDAMLIYPNQIAVDAHDNVYVGTDATPVVVFSPGAEGDAAPSQLIGVGVCAGTEGVSVDAIGRVVVACDPIGESTPAGQGSGYGLFVFANGAVDHSIFGPATGASQLVSTAVDAAGRIYTGDFYGADGTSGVYVFGAGASGNVAPEAMLSGVDGIAVAVAP